MILFFSKISDVLLLLLQRALPLPVVMEMFDTNVWPNFILFGRCLGTAAILRHVCVCVCVCVCLCANAVSPGLVTDGWTDTS
jgi:hypothetical protein